MSSWVDGTSVHIGWLSKLWSPFLGPLNTRCLIIILTPKWTIILTTTYMLFADTIHFGSCQLPSTLRIAGP